MPDLEVFVVIVAGGTGSRMNSKIRKQYMLLNGTPVLTRVLRLFTVLDFVTDIVLVVPSDDISYCDEHILSSPEFLRRVHLVSGGKERQESVMEGLTAVKNKSFYDNSIVLIHDGVRPFADIFIIERCVREAVIHGACIPAIPVTDTLKKVSPEGFIIGTLDRKNLFRAQTPQAFQLNLVLDAHKKAIQSGVTGTDDASLLEYFGKKVMMIPGSRQNIKITTREDLLFAEFLLSQKKQTHAYGQSFF